MSLRRLGVGSLARLVNGGAAAARTPAGKALHVVAAVVGLATVSFAGLIPGGGPTKSDCYVETSVEGIANPSSRVRKNRQALVTDGEEGDQGDCGDEKCIIRVGLCINQNDPNLPACKAPAGLDRLKVKGKINVLVPQLLQGSICGAFVEVVVPTKVKRDKAGNVKSVKAGKAKITLSAKAPKGTKPRTDDDTVTLVCVPRTVACPTTTTTLTSTTTTTTLVSGCFMDTGDGTIDDTCTGLQWEKKTTEIGLQYVHNVYSWTGCCGGFCSGTNACQPDAAAAATCAVLADGGTQGCSTCPSETDLCDVDPYRVGALTTVWGWLNYLNAGKFGGHDDWRLPSEGACNACRSDGPPYTCASCSPHELETILLELAPCGTSPCIDSIFGPTASGAYWSASTFTPVGAWLAWGVDFSNGFAETLSKDRAFSVRAVRVGIGPTTTSASSSSSTSTSTSTSSTEPPTTTTLVSGCFTDTGDGTIHDTCTGLQWERKTSAVGSGPNPTDLHDVDNWYTWAGQCAADGTLCQPNAAAAASCAGRSDGGTTGCSSTCSGTCNVDPYGVGAITTVWDWVNQLNAANFAGHSDWRLPSEGGQNSPPTGTNELETILLDAYPCYTSPCIDPILGPTAPGYYWSASTNAALPFYAWGVIFQDGFAGYDFKHAVNNVRAVR